MTAKNQAGCYCVTEVFAHGHHILSTSEQLETGIEEDISLEFISRVYLRRYSKVLGSANYQRASCFGVEVGLEAFNWAKWIIVPAWHRSCKEKSMAPIEGGEKKKFSVSLGRFFSSLYKSCKLITVSKFKNIYKKEKWIPLFNIQECKW